MGKRTVVEGKTLNTAKLGYNELGCWRTLGYNKQILSQIGPFSTHTVITNPGYNEWTVPSYSL